MTASHALTKREAPTHPTRSLSTEAPRIPVNSRFLGARGRQARWEEAADTLVRWHAYSF